MAEQEIAKHGKNVIHLMTKKEHTLAHRIREIAIEIATIVFAVSMSIWLHGLSEHHHQQQEVRSFLLGLRTDLKDDIGALTRIVDGYHEFDKNFAYLSSLEAGKEPDWKKFNAAFEFMDANWYFIPNKSRFEGFMMSGKLSNIENEAILNPLLNLYQSLLPQIRTSEGGWAERQHILRAFRDDRLDSDEAREHYRLITSPKAKMILAKMQASPQIYERYQTYIEQSRQLLKAIDAAYPDAAGAKAH
jgi:hypothetical protein